ncbi:MAG: ABC transporter ATP-binding protein [Lachnospiraceae bacterium]|nr:ABC transporter ATP-binding protein [Lachnospiraceae bacterium]
MALLSVKKLNISVDVPGGEKRLVKDVSFEVGNGEILGFVGASGSGKSLTSMAIAHILRKEYKVSSEEVLFDSRRIDLMSERELCDVRGREIAYVFQEPMTSLNPLLRIGRQVAEPLEIHGIKFSTKVEKENAVKQALKEAGLEPTRDLLRAYPHQLSGGQRQRVMIAMAFICNPLLLVADEITTALDVDTTNVIAELLLERRKRYGTSIIFISHDTKLVERVSDRILHMKNGEMLENHESPEEVERELMAAKRAEEAEIRALEGSETFCEDTDEQIALGNKIADSNKNNALNDKKVILEVKNLSFAYSDRSVLGKVTLRPVLKNVSLVLREGETLGIVGKSGSGKSTLVKTICGLQKSNEGEITYARGSEFPQMVFQDPYSSLNPARSVGRILYEAIRMGERRAAMKGEKKKVSRTLARQVVFDMLKSVDLKSEIAYRKISELSGGERQRVAIAAALITRPGIVILDEPVSAIDANVQEQILALLKKLKETFGCSYIFISHDPEVIAKICDRVLVIEDGSIKEKR